MRGCSWHGFNREDAGKTFGSDETCLIKEDLYLIIVGIMTCTRFCPLDSVPIVHVKDRSLITRRDGVLQSQEFADKKPYVPPFKKNSKKIKHVS